MSELKALLDRYERGELTREDFLERLSSYRDLGYAKIDKRRGERTGYPEVILGSHKTPEQIRGIFLEMAKSGEPVICTRVSATAAGKVLEAIPDARYYERPRMMILKKGECASVGLVAVATGGTADEPVAEEAALTLECFGSKVARLYDVGVAGVHRLMDNLSLLRESRVVVAVAGMEGALPSVIAGLVSVPVIAVPTSVGYGAHFGGVTPLLAMLSSCAVGVSVVNIDNGFGAGYVANLINRGVSQR